MGRPVVVEVAEHDDLDRLARSNAATRVGLGPDQQFECLRDGLRKIRDHALPARDPRPATKRGTRTLGRIGDAGGRPRHATGSGGLKTREPRTAISVSSDWLSRRSIASLTVIGSPTTVETGGGGGGGGVGAEAFTIVTSDAGTGSENVQDQTAGDPDEDVDAAGVAA